MLRWFETIAPIRTKFNVLIAVQAVAISVASGSAIYQVFHAGGADSYRVALIAILAALASVATMLVAKKKICDPYVTTVVRMEGLAAGDLSSPVQHTENLDCVGRMTKAMAIFRKNAEEVGEAGAAQELIVQALGANLGRLATGDLDARITEPFPSQYEKLRQDFNGAVEALADAVRAVAASTVNINTGASEISQASNDLSRRTEQQAASLEETAAAMDEITTTVREAAQSAARANEAVIQAREEAEQSGQVVNRAIEAMSGIERASNEISEIISVIDGIAFQTNLLALNAGVEAARAGDAGKGFAVVASEVRALAQRSADAAKDVKTRITASSEQVDAGVALVSETGRALGRIIARIGEVDGLVGDIASSAEQQANGLQQVNTAVTEMDGVTQQNAAMVEQSTAAARSLAAEAHELAQHIGRFRSEAISAQPAVHTNNVHKFEARASSTVRQVARASQVGRAALAAAAGDDWSEF